MGLGRCRLPLTYSITWADRINFQGKIRKKCLHSLVLQVPPFPVWSVESEMLSYGKAFSAETWWSFLWGTWFVQPSLYKVCVGVSVCVAHIGKRQQPQLLVHREDSLLVDYRWPISPVSSECWQRSVGSSAWLWHQASFSLQMTVSHISERRFIWQYLLQTVPFTFPWMCSTIPKLCKDIDQLWQSNKANLRKQWAPMQCKRERSDFPASYEISQQLEMVKRGP